MLFPGDLGYLHPNPQSLPLCLRLSPLMPTTRIDTLVPELKVRIRVNIQIFSFLFLPVYCCILRTKHIPKSKVYCCCYIYDIYMIFHSYIDLFTYVHQWLVENKNKTGQLLQFCETVGAGSLRIAVRCICSLILIKYVPLGNRFSLFLTI